MMVSKSSVLRTSFKINDSRRSRGIIGEGEPPKVGEPQRGAPRFAVR